MSNFLLQLQLLLAALSALLPLLPDTLRTRAGEILDVAGKALSLGGALAASGEELAQKLTAIARKSKPWPARATASRPTNSMRPWRASAPRRARSAKRFTPRGRGQTNPHRSGEAPAHTAAFARSPAVG